MQSLKLFIAALVVGIAGIGTAFGQTPLSFEIPFDFQVGKTEMKAGKYELHKMGDKKFVLKNIESNESQFIISDAQVGNEKSVTVEKIVFNRYGETYFLREIYNRRGTVGRELGESKTEKKVRKDYQEKNPQLAKDKSLRRQVSINSTQ